MLLLPGVFSDSPGFLLSLWYEPARLSLNGLNEKPPTDSQKAEFYSAFFVCIIDKIYTILILIDKEYINIFF